MVDTPVVVRECTAQDLPQLADHEPRPGAKLARAHFDDAAASEQEFYVALVDDAYAGWGVLDRTDEELGAQLAHLWVFPEARRHGVGSALAGRIEQRAAELGHDEIFLLVDPDNGKAVALWLDLGYKATGDHATATTVESGAETHQAIYRKSLKKTH